MSRRSDYWHCIACGYSRNSREDGPVCDNCGVDATVVERVEREGCVSDNEYARAAGIRMPPVMIPVTREDFVPNGQPTDSEDIPF